jgi:hypothetical protein
MPLPTNRPSNEVVVSVALADISAESTAYAVAPVSGRLVRAFSVLNSAITGADCTWVVEVNGVAVTGTVTVANSGSGAGTIDSITYPQHVPVVEGQLIAFNSAGEASTTAIANFYAVIRTS